MEEQEQEQDMTRAEMLQDDKTQLDGSLITLGDDLNGIVEALIEGKQVPQGKIQNILTQMDEVKGCLASLEDDLKELCL
jgi:hypothetical protein